MEKLNGRSAQWYLNFVGTYARKTKTFNIEMSLMEKKLFIVNMTLSGTLNSGGGEIFFMRQRLIIQDYRERLSGYSSKDCGFQTILAFKDLEVRVSYLKTDFSPWSIIIEMKCCQTNLSVFNV